MMYRITIHSVDLEFRDLKNMSDFVSSVLHKHFKNVSDFLLNFKKVNMYRVSYDRIELLLKYYIEDIECRNKIDDVFEYACKLSKYNNFKVLDITNNFIDNLYSIATKKIKVCREDVINAIEQYKKSLDKYHKRREIAVKAMSSWFYNLLNKLKKLSKYSIEDIEYSVYEVLIDDLYLLFVLKYTFVKGVYKLPNPGHSFICLIKNGKIYCVKYIGLKFLNDVIKNLEKKENIYNNIVYSSTILSFEEVENIIKNTIKESEVDTILKRIKLFLI